MTRNTIDRTVAEQKLALPGPMYPDRCLQCPELLHETYGAVGYLRCAECVFADLARAQWPKPRGKQ